MQTGFAQGDTNKIVLVIYDGGREFSSIAQTDRSIETTLNAALPNRVTIFREYMDLTRVYATNYEENLRSFYRSKYSGNKPDAIIAIRGRPLDFLLKPGEVLFPETPIVSSGMDLRQMKVRKLPPSVTGNSVRVRYWPTLALALALKPETKEVFVICGASPNDRALEALARDELREHERELKITYLSGLPMASLIQRVANLPFRAVVLFACFAQDGEGRSFIPNDAVTRIAHAANAPTFIASSDVLDCEAVGGDLMSFSELGIHTAKLALRILEGERATDIQFADFSARTKILDARQLKRWEIPLSRVPSDSVLLNRTPTLWEAYRWWIVGGASLLVLQSAMIGALLFQRGRRRMAEQSLRVSEAHGRAAVLEERNRMARDMHDTLAQGFTGVIVQLEAAQNAFTHGSLVEGKEHNRRATELARQSLGEARRSVRALRPQALEQGDLCLALDALLKQMLTGTTLQAKFTVRGRARTLPPSWEDNLLRIQQEALTNALKHSGAKRVTVTLSFEGNGVHLEVKDDGVGFGALRDDDGLGLVGIRERANHMNGELKIESQAGKGTRVYVALPNPCDTHEGML